MFTDVFIDDSRARKVLGYRNTFNNAQTIRWVVESVNADLLANVRRRVQDEIDQTNQLLARD